MATSALALTGTGGPAQAQTADPSRAVVLDEITVVPSKTEETATESLTSTSVVTSQELEILQPTDIGDVFFGMPSVNTALSQDRTGLGQSINIRGLQDFGRVAVILDGARNNFQRNDHGSASTVWVEPEMLEQVTVVRGPVSNIYGSGAIGGVVMFETKSADDFLLPHETAAVSGKARYETNGEGVMTSGTAAARITESFDVIGNVVWRTADDYEDGAGNTVPDSSYDLLGGLLKATFRPADFQEIEVGWIGNFDEWEEPSTSVPQSTELELNTYTAKYTWNDPSNPWIDLRASAFVTDTKQEQTALESAFRVQPGTGTTILVPAGSVRTFDLVTTGFDVSNTTRFETGPLRHAVTYGGDWFEDDVTTTDPLGGAGVYSPSGVRTAYGLFVQDKVEYSDWLEIIGGARWDGYELEGTDTLTGAPLNTEDDRVSPRLTVGVKPFEDEFLHGLQIYGTYAEGYRSPSVIETLMSGLHPVGVQFPFLPNPNLRPETAHTVEFGLNFERDNILQPGDGIRIKAAWFQNDVDDYIELIDDISPFPGPNFNPACTFAPPPGPIPAIPVCAQYQNIAKARITGVEFEGVYDAGRFFAGLSASALQGTNEADGTPLLSVPPSQVTGRLGFRFLENRLTLGGEIQKVADKKDDAWQVLDGHTLVNLFMSYEATENLRFDVRLNNIFDQEYIYYLNQAVVGDPILEPGFNAKFAATVRFGTQAPGIFAQ